MIYRSSIKSAQLLLNGILVTKLLSKMVEKVNVNRGSDVDSPVRAGMQLHRKLAPCRFLFPNRHLGTFILTYCSEHIR